jgi:hypothetical protein
LTASGKVCFTSGKALAKHFGTALPTIGRILKKHFGLQKASRKKVPYELTEDQNGSGTELPRNFWMVREMMNRYYFCVLLLEVNLGFHIVTNPLTVTQSSARQFHHEGRQ